jgi:hypothetical protein
VIIGALEHVPFWFSENRGLTAKELAKELHAALALGIHSR